MTAAAAVIAAGTAVWAAGGFPVLPALPLFPGTQGILHRDTIPEGKDGGILLSSSCGPAVAEQDLADARNSGRVPAAGVDVVSPEPIRPEGGAETAQGCTEIPAAPARERGSEKDSPGRMDKRKGEKHLLLRAEVRFFRIPYCVFSDM